MSKRNRPDYVREFPQVKFNKKILTALHVALDDKTRLITFEGTIRSVKTVTAVIAFHYRVMQSKAKFHLIASRTLETLRRNIIDAEMGFMSLFPGIYEYQQDDIGSYYLAVKSPDGIEKQILLAGYSDVAKWKSVLGGGIENIMIDEVNIADELFVKECLGRQVSAPKPWTIYTLNGDDPNLPIYTERINKSIIIGDCPASTRAEMQTKFDTSKFDEISYAEQEKWLKRHTKEEWKGRPQNLKKRGYFYIWWSFEDNPTMTPERIRETKSMYPFGSYHYRTRVKGERGSWGSMIYVDYMSESLLTDCYVIDPKTGQERIRPEIVSFVIAGDIAGNRAFNGWGLIGYNKAHSRAWLCDIDMFPSRDARGTKVGYEFKTKKLLEFIASHPGLNYEMICPDSAEQSYCNDLSNRKDLPAPIVPSYKKTILERIDMDCVLFSAGRMMFDRKRCYEAYIAFMSGKWVKGREGREREDLGLKINDIIDLVEYGLTPYMTALTRG